MTAKIDRLDTGQSLRRVALTLALLWPVVAPADAGIEPLPALVAAAEHFLAQQAAGDFSRHEITISSPDPRLKLAACDRPLVAFLPPGGQLWGNTSVGVRCAGSKPWTVYLTAAVKGMRKVVVLRRAVPRGAMLSPGDLALEEREVTDRPDAYLYDIDRAAGMIAKRALATHAVLSATMLGAPLLVRRGQQIILLARTAGLEVRMSGTALSDGAEGEVVRCKNAASNRIVEGLVIRPGVIQVTM